MILSRLLLALSLLMPPLAHGTSGLEDVPQTHTVLSWAHNEDPNNRALWEGAYHHLKGQNWQEGLCLGFDHSRAMSWGHAAAHAYHLALEAPFWEKSDHFIKAADFAKGQLYLTFNVQRPGQALAVLLFSGCVYVPAIRTAYYAGLFALDEDTRATHFAQFFEFDEAYEKTLPTPPGCVRPQIIPLTTATLDAKVAKRFSEEERDPARKSVLEQRALDLETFVQTYQRKLCPLDARPQEPTCSSSQDEPC